MFVIIKAIPQNINEIELREFLADINLPHKTKWKLRDKNDGFVSDISNIKKWGKTKKNILIFLEKNKDFLQALTAKKFKIIIDIEIDKEDVLSQNYILSLILDFEFMKTLVSLSITCEISLYLGGIFFHINQDGCNAET